MRTTISRFLLLMLLGCAVVLPPCSAQTDDAGDSTEQTTTKGKKAKKAKKAKKTDDAAEDEATDDKAAEPEKKNAFVAAFKNIKSLGGKLNAKAKYYIYLESASWCGPCKKIMPDIVKEYKGMRKAGVEIILVGHDKTDAEVKAYLKSHHAKFPAVCSSGPAASKLPSYSQASGIPHATWMDVEGNVFLSGHGADVLKWQEIIKQKQDQEAAGDNGPIKY